MKNLKDLKKYIIYTINPEWSTLEKVRYAYIISGKYLTKHTEFFLTVDEKLDDGKLSTRKLDKVYQGRLTKDEWNKMVCKTSATFLREVLDDIGIKSNLVETVKYIKIKGMKHHLHHFTLCINVDGVNIFATPASDYPYIKYGMSTKHFGISVPYILEDKQIYKGYEINHVVLSKEELKKIDEKIGYTTTIVKPDKKGKPDNKCDYIDDFIKNGKNTYLDYLAETTSFYQSIMPENEEEREIKSVIDPTNNWNFIIDKICSKVGKRIAEITNHEYDSKEFVGRVKFNEWCQNMESMIDKSIYNEREYRFANPLLLYNKARGLVRLIIKYYDIFIKYNYSMSDIDAFKSSFNRLLRETSYHFIDEKFVIEPKDSDNYVSNTYINHKFITLFPLLTDVNSGYKNKNEFEGFSEQNEIFKRTIELMFQELNSKNLLKTPDPSFKYAPIFKRINLFTARKRNANEYITYISITDSEEPNTANYWYKYDFNDNSLRKTNLAIIAIETSVHGRYEIISNRLKKELGEIEEETEIKDNKKRELTLY